MEPRPPHLRGPSPRPPAEAGSAGAPSGPAMQPRRPRPPQPMRSPAPGMPGVRPSPGTGQVPLAGRRSPMPPARSPAPGMRPPMQPSRSPAPGVRPMSTPGRSPARSPAPGMHPPMPARSPAPGMRPSPARSPLPRRTAVTPQPGMPAASPGAQIRRMGPPSPRPGPMGRPPPVSPGPGVRPAPGVAPGAAAGAAAAPPPPAAAPPNGPARSKRAARAYHQDASAVPASSGWNDVMARPPPPQAAWQQQAAARVDYRAAQAPQPPPEDNLDAALDQVPGHRNVLSQSQLNFNRAALRGSQQVHPSTLGNQGVGAPGAVGSTPTPGAGPMGQPGAADRAQRPKIDPDHIPSPVDAQFADQQFFYHDMFGTCSREGMPLSTTAFAAVDQGNCSPKFMRLTTYCVPATEEVANASKMPIALNVQPFAQLRADEERVPLCNAGESGPPRCKRCRAYINPWCLFVEGGMKWICSLCGASTEVSQDYFCNLDINGRRADLDQRPELTHGSVDFCVPTEYWAVQAPTDVSSMLPVPGIVPTYTAELTTSTRLQENVDKLGNLNPNSQGKKTAAKAAKAAGDVALDTLNLGKGQTTVRAPRPLTHVFLIDVSFSAVRCGALQTCVRAIKQALYGTEVQALNDSGVPGFGLPPGSQVCIITFDQAIHFYNLDSSLDHAQMLVMADLEEPFIPISGGLLVDPWASRHVIENLLNELPANFANTTVAEASLGAATRTAQAVLNGIGGQLNIFLSTIPTIGPGKLAHREDTKLYGTDHEKNLFVPQDSFYPKMGEQFALAGVGVNVFFFPSQYIDVASIGYMAAQSGGQVFFHPRFDPVRDGSRVIAEVQRIVLRETAYNVTLRIRCSPGLRIVKQFGGFHLHGVTDVETGTWDADKTFTALLRHDGRLEESREAYFQCAILYTTATGERRVRCHTLAVPVTSVLGNVFRYADMDSAVAFYAKEAVTLAYNKPLKDVRSYLTAKCVAILLAYRRNCASSTSPGQLILPESFKLFPLYVLALIKNKAIKGGNVTSDVRIFFFRLLLSQSVSSIMTLLYPRMVPLHLLSSTDGFPIQSAVGLPPEKQAIDDSLLKVVQMPRPMRPSFMRMEPNGAYLLDNGEWCLLWLGAQVSPQFLEDLYGVTSLDELDPRMTSLPDLPTRLSQQVRSIVQALAEMHGKVMLQVVMARQNRDGMEVEFANNLVEDQNNDAMSYVDYLCHVHRVISSDMNSGRDEKDASASLWKGFI